MKILFIESKQKNLINKISKNEIKKLPKKLFLAYTIQYKELAFKVKKQLEQKNIKIKRFQQILGCTNLDNGKENNLPILFIGTGEFHLLNLYLQAPIIYKLENNKIKQVLEENIKRLKNHRKSALIRFFSAENLGILVSTKPGQENLKHAEKLKKRIKQRKKQAYIFITNNIDINQFENFNIDSWINTACPGLAYDNTKIINLNEIPKKL